MQYNCLMINMDELWLKGANKFLFTDRLKKNIKKTLKSFHDHPVEYTSLGPKHIVKSKVPFSDLCIEKCLKTPGLHSLSLVVETKLDLESAQKTAVDLFSKLQAVPTTFKVETKRSNKKFPLSSMEISREIGASLLNAYDFLSAKMKSPDVKLRAQILKNNIYLSFETKMGPGGIPVGMSGRMLTLLSGGIDSPVASYLMAKRGVDQTLLFFHAYPFVGNEVLDKVKRLTQTLGQYLQHCPLFIIPIGNIQTQIAENCPPGYQTVLFRVYMLKIAEKMLRRTNAEGIITGDALAQVASQTLKNINCVDRCLAGSSIFRPLIGFNKIEIQNIAKQVGTYNISIEPHDDACALLAPKSPVTAGRPGVCLEFLNENPMIEEMEEAIMSSKKIAFNQKGTYKEFSGEQLFNYN